MNTDECEEIFSSRKETGYTSQPTIIFTGYPDWKSWVRVKGRKRVIQRGEKCTTKGSMKKEKHIQLSCRIMNFGLQWKSYQYHPVQ